MLDVQHIPNPFDMPDAQYFWPGQVTGATVAWQIWKKPRSKSLLHIVAIGGGAGGGAGRSNSVQFAGGGGGGGSSAISCLIYPMWALPDELYLLVGHGGKGGVPAATADGGIGAAGQLSYVSLYPNIAANNLFAVSGAAAAAGGVGGTTSTAAGGVAGTISALTDQPFSCWAFANFLAGVAGTAGGAGTGNNAGTTLAIGTASMILAGTGGGGVTNGTTAGGVISSLANTPFIGNTATSGGNGSPGYRDDLLPLIYGGTGGGGQAVAPGVGGQGGSCGCNAPGAGGGGGGGGNQAGGGGSLGGKGGDGGPGLIMMLAK